MSSISSCLSNAINIFYSICRGLRKPNSLKYHDYIEECSQILPDAGVAETDKLLPFCTRINRLGEEVSDAFDYSNHGEWAKLDPMRIEVFNKTFAQHFQDIQRYFPREAWNTRGFFVSGWGSDCMNFTSYIANTIRPPPYLHRRNISPRYRTRYKSKPPHTSHPLPHYLLVPLSLSNRTINLLSPRRKILPRHYPHPHPQEFHHFTAPDYMHLFYAILLLGNPTENYDCPSFNNNQIRQAANLR